MVSGPDVDASLHTLGDEGVVLLRVRLDHGVDDVWSALTEPERLARWYGRIEGDLRVGGLFAAFIPSSGWDGQGRIEICVPKRSLRVTTWEEVGEEQVLTVELTAEGGRTSLILEKRGVSPDVLWAFGSGWHAHLEDLAAHLAGRESVDWPAS